MTFGRLVLAAALLAWPGTGWAQRFQAVLSESGRAQVAGVVRLDAAQRMEVVSARPGRSALLRRMADDVNAETVMHLEAAPGPGQPALADVTIPVERGDARFVAALRQYLRRYYAIILR